MKRLLILFVFMPLLGMAQVGIGTTTPDASSILDITSTTSGILVPRMTTTQRDAISSPENSLLIFNTTTNTFQMNSGTKVSPQLGKHV